MMFLREFTSIFRVLSCSLCHQTSFVRYSSTVAQRLSLKKCFELYRYKGFSFSSLLVTCSFQNQFYISSRSRGYIVAVSYLQRSHNRRGRGFRRKRYCAPRSWFRKKNTAVERDLTVQNTKFLEDVAIEQYRQPTSPSFSPLRSSVLLNIQEHLPDHIKITSPQKDFENEIKRKWVLEGGSKTLRCGVLAVKIGVLPQWTIEGKRILCTLLQVIDNHVIGYIPPDKFSLSPRYKRWWYTPDKREPCYGCNIVGALSVDPRRVHPRYLELFANSGVPPKRKITRFIVSHEAALPPGTPLYARHFLVGQYVDCQAKTIGHGFQGVMKRWGMRGLGETHGVTKAHHKMGATGGGRKRGIWKGKRMPGHMGMMWRTQKANRIWRIDSKHNVIYIRGSMPGPTHAYVRVYDTGVHIKRLECFADSPENEDATERNELGGGRRIPPLPTYYPTDPYGISVDNDGDFESDLLYEELHPMGAPTIEYEPPEEIDSGLAHLGGGGKKRH